MLDAGEKPGVSAFNTANLAPMRVPALKTPGYKRRPLKGGLSSLTEKHKPWAHWQWFGRVSGQAMLYSRAQPFLFAGPGDIIEARLP